jgi:hypothetical protein
MRVKSSLSPYPILNNYSDDYISSSFSVDYEVTTQFREVYGKLIFKLDNDDIAAFIASGSALYVVHIESPITCYRKVIKSSDTEIEFKIDSVSISKEIQIRTFIVLTKDIQGYTSTKFHPDYDGMSFDISAHQILAIGTAMDYKVIKDDRDLDSLPSIFQITRLKDKKKGSMTVDTDNDTHITLGLADEVFDRYCQLGKSTFRNTAFSLVLMPALIVVLQRMYLNKDDPSYTSMHWYQVIEAMLEKNGYTIDTLDISTDNLLSICQAVFADPVARSMDELERCGERMN